MLRKFSVIEYLEIISFTEALHLNTCSLYIMKVKDALDRYKASYRDEELNFYKGRTTFTYFAGSSHKLLYLSIQHNE